MSDIDRYLNVSKNLYTEHLNTGCLLYLNVSKNLFALIEWTNSDSKTELEMQQIKAKRDQIEKFSWNKKAKKWSKDTVGIRLLDIWYSNGEYVSHSQMVH